MSQAPPSLVENEVLGKLYYKKWISHGLVALSALFSRNNERFPQVINSLIILLPFPPLFHFFDYGKIYPMSSPTKQTFASPLKVPPQDIYAEQALLGSIMIKPDSIYEISDMITPRAFYSGKHKVIFEAMMALNERNEPIDLISLTTYLKENNKLEKAGGSSYLPELISVVPTAANVKNYADIVVKKAALRELIFSADQILELGYNERDNIDTVFDQAEKIIFGLANFSQKTFTNIKDALGEAWDRFDKLHKSKEGIRGVPTGFKELDNLLSGFQPSDLIILAARPSMGKTSLALDIARNVACRHEQAVGIFSLEMSTQQLVDRIIASESRVNSWELRTGRVKNDEDFTKIRDALSTLSTAPIFIDDEPGNNIIKMKASARRMQAEHGLKLIIVDYLQLMVPRKDTDSMVQQVTEISRSLKGLARELNVPVIALSQLSRAVEQRGGRPRLSDLRDSGSIEQDADVVMFIHREKNEDDDTNKKNNMAEILVEKHRNGPVGKIDLYFDEHRVSFNSVEKGDFGGF